MKNSATPQLSSRTKLNVAKILLNKVQSSRFIVQPPRFAGGWQSAFRV